MGNRSSAKKSTQRTTDSKEVKSSYDGYISFSFRYFQNYDKEPVQSLNSWQDENRLLDMLESLKYISQNHITKLRTDEKLALYGSFPDSKVNDFPLPNQFNGTENWGTLRNIGGQQVRIAGFLRDNIFYIVYLDKEHRFYKSNK